MERAYDPEIHRRLPTSHCKPLTTLRPFRDLETRFRYRRSKYDLHDLRDQEDREHAHQLLEELKKWCSRTKSRSPFWTKQP
jgi:hypothetical protein